MPTISGGRVIEPNATGANPGIRARVYPSNGVPTDGNIGLTIAAANGMLAEDITNGNLYERQAGAWVRVDTIAGAVG
jgi:hypothetical protein